MENSYLVEQQHLDDNKASVISTKNFFIINLNYILIKIQVLLKENLSWQIC